jgi:glycosyltransferase involved in cell wall biosynthesis
MSGYSARHAGGHWFKSSIAHFPNIPARPILPDELALFFQIDLFPHQCLCLSYCLVLTNFPPLDSPYQLLFPKLFGEPSCWNKATVLIVIPVFNEFKYVDDVLFAVHKYSDNILVVDDGSVDGTSNMLKKHTYIQVISHRVNKGYGQSLIDAFNFAYRNNFDWVITIDCDHQHEPSYIPCFYSEIEKDNADIISGSRYLRRINLGSVPPPADRVAINRRITDILNRNLILSLTDAFCGFKAYRTKAIFSLKLTERGYGLPLQLWVRASRAGLRIREIPVPLIYHDAKRHFCGVLENSQKRLDYYIMIIERELRYNVSQQHAISLHS